VSAFSQDPIAADINLYRYCGNDPLDSTDPMGLSKHGKRNIKVSCTKGTPTPAQLEQMIKEAKASGASLEHINALRGWLKVIKRGGLIVAAVCVVFSCVEVAQAEEECRKNNTKTLIGPRTDKAIECLIDFISIIPIQPARTNCGKAVLECRKRNEEWCKSHKLNTEGPVEKKTWPPECIEFEIGK
jgi:hypothetical protein